MPGLFLNDIIIGFVITGIFSGAQSVKYFFYVKFSFQRGS